MNDHTPLAPTKFNLQSYDSIFAPIKHKPGRQEKRSSKSLVYVLVAVVVLFAAILVFAIVVMRPTNPRARLGLVTVRNLERGNSSASPFVDITLDAELAIKNNNFGRFDFDNTTVRFMYGGVMVGEARLGRGSVKARGIEKVNVMVNVRSARLSSEVNGNLSSDLSSDWILKLSSYAVLRGRVHLIKIVKKRTAVMNCTMGLHVTSRLIEYLLCA